MKVELDLEAALEERLSMIEAQIKAIQCSMSDFADDVNRVRDMPTKRDETFRLKKSMWHDGYYYLSEEDSLMYDEVRHSDNPRDMKIKKLLLQKAEASYGEHCRSTY